MSKLLEKIKGKLLGLLKAAKAFLEGVFYEGCSDTAKISSSKRITRVRRRKSKRAVPSGVRRKTKRQ